MGGWTVCALVLLSACAVRGAAGVACDPGDRAALVAFYEATGGDGWDHRKGWLKGDPCEDAWHGVVCTAAGRVQGLGLQMNSLEGSIPDAIGDLTELKVLMLSLNHLTGAIPSVMCRMTSLEAVEIGYNYLTASLACFAALPGLRSLDLEFNDDIQGRLEELAPLKELTDLNVRSVRLLGDVAAVLAAHPKLRSLRAAKNRLTGELPVSFPATLEELDLEATDVTGTVPEALVAHPALRSLSLVNTLMHGAVPPVSAPLLRKLALAHNEFDAWAGFAAPGAGRALAIEHVDLSHNPWRVAPAALLAAPEGETAPTPIPVRFAHLRSLRCSGCGLSGPIPAAWFSLPSLRDLLAAGNELRGCLGAAITRGLAGDDGDEEEEEEEEEAATCSGDGSEEQGKDGGCTLELLALSHNALQGPFPAAIRACKRLRSVDVSYNALKGALPKDALAVLRRVHVMRLHANGFTGAVPDAFGRWTRVRELTLHDNQLDTEPARLPDSLRALLYAAVVVQEVSAAAEAGMRPTKPAWLLPKARDEELTQPTPRVTLHNNRDSGLLSFVGDGAAWTDSGPAAARARQWRACGTRNDMYAEILERNGWLESNDTVASTGLLFAERVLMARSTRDAARLEQQWGRVPQSLKSTALALARRERDATESLGVAAPRGSDDLSENPSWSVRCGVPDLRRGCGALVETGALAKEAKRVWPRTRTGVALLVAESQRAWLFHASYGRCVKKRFYGALHEYQRVSRFPDMEELSEKGVFAWNFARFRRRFPQVYSFFPASYMLPRQEALFRETWKGDPERMWLLKPTNRCCGKGIRLLEPGDALPSKDEGWIAQEFVRSLLVRGHKFVLRLFSTILSFAPLRFAFHDDGVLFYTNGTFSAADKTEAGKRRYITDYVFTEAQARLVLRPRGLLWALEAAGVGDADQVWGDITRMATRALLAGQTRQGREQREYVPGAAAGGDSPAYEVMGFDVLLDSQLRPQLCEVNEASNMGLEVNYAEGPRHADVEARDRAVKLQLMDDTLVMTGVIPAPTLPAVDASPYMAYERPQADWLARHAAATRAAGDTASDAGCGGGVSLSTVPAASVPLPRRARGHRNGSWVAGGSGKGTGPAIKPTEVERAEWFEWAAARRTAAVWSQPLAPASHSEAAEEDGAMEEWRGTAKAGEGDGPRRIPSAAWAADVVGAAHAAYRRIVTAGTSGERCSGSGEEEEVEVAASGEVAGADKAGDQCSADAGSLQAGSLAHVVAPDAAALLRAEDDSAVEGLARAELERARREGGSSEEENEGEGKRAFSPALVDPLLLRRVLLAAGTAAEEGTVTGAAVRASIHGHAAKEEDNVPWFFAETQRRQRQGWQWRGHRRVRAFVEAVVGAELGRWEEEEGACPVGACAGGNAVPAPSGACFGSAARAAVVEYEMLLQRAYVTQLRYAPVFPCASCSPLLREMDFVDEGTRVAQLWIDRRHGWRGTWLEWAAEYGACEAPQAAYE